MTDTLDTLAHKVTDARVRGDADGLAEALARHANALLQDGQTAAARNELDEAAAIHRVHGRAYDEARCTQFAATLCRFLGQYDQARQRADAALALVNARGPIAVSAHTELGEIALATGDATAAIAAFGAALDAGRETGLIDSARATLLRRRAVALTAMQQFAASARDLSDAHDLLMAAGDRAAATRALIEQATALRQGGMKEDAQHCEQRALLLADATSDRAALADLQLLLATDALERRDAPAAMCMARSAREHALASNAPTSYIGAAVAIAGLAESSGDRVAAYEALAVGWVTLTDLLGAAMARAAFEPKLRQLRERWGAAEFDAVKKNYEARRKKLV